MKNLGECRKAIDDSVALIARLMGAAKTTAARKRYFEALKVLDSVATRIDAEELQSLNGAINDLRKQFEASTASLQAIHKRAQELKTALGLATKGIEAVGALAKAVAT